MRLSQHCHDLLIFVLPNSSSNQPSNFTLRIQQVTLIITTKLLLIQSDLVSLSLTIAQSRSAAGISAPERVCAPREFSRRRQRRPAAIQLYARDDALLRPHAARRGKGDRAPARVISGGVLATRRLPKGCVAPRTTAKWATTWPLASSGAKEGSSEGS